MCGRPLRRKGLCLANSTGRVHPCVRSRRNLWHAPHTITPAIIGEAPLIALVRLPHSAAKTRPSRAARVLLRPLKWLSVSPAGRAIGALIGVGYFAELAVSVFGFDNTEDRKHDQAYRGSDGDQRPLRSAAGDANYRREPQMRGGGEVVHLTLAEHD